MNIDLIMNINHIWLIEIFDTKGESIEKHFTINHENAEKAVSHFAKKYNLEDEYIHDHFHGKMFSHNGTYVFTFKITNVLNADEIEFYN